jgi:hypothetical protein
MPEKKRERETGGTRSGGKRGAVRDAVFALKKKQNNVMAGEREKDESFS